MTVLEMGFTLAVFLVPFFITKAYEEIITDVFIYLLMGSSAATSFVSGYFAISGCCKKCKEKKKNKQKQKEEKEEKEVTIQKEKELEEDEN